MAQRFSGWGNWLLMAWGVGILGYGIWKGSKLVLALVLFVVVGLMLQILIGRRRRRLQGYWVEYVPPPVVHTGEHEFIVVYHEGSERLTFHGIERLPPERPLLFLPGEDRWDGTVEPWARGRREAILERLRTHPIVRHCEISEGEPAREP